MDWARLSATADRLALGYLGGVEVTTPWGSGEGFLDQNSELVLEGQVVMVDYVLKAQSSVAAQLDYGDEVTIGGRAFDVTHKALRYSDGSWVMVPVQPQEKLPVVPFGGLLTIDGNVSGADADVVDGNKS